jgi:hypothetical protein
MDLDWYLMGATKSKQTQTLSCFWSSLSSYGTYLAASFQGPNPDQEY